MCVCVCVRKFYFEMKTAGKAAVAARGSPSIFHASLCPVFGSECNMSENAREKGKLGINRLLVRVNRVGSRYKAFALGIKTFVSLNFVLYAAK